MGVSSKRSCRASQNRSTSASSVTGWGIDSDYCDIEWFALEKNRDHSVIFEIASILKEISPGCSLEEMMLKLKLQYFGHLMRRVDSLEKTQMLEGLGERGEGDDRG